MQRIILVTITAGHDFEAVVARRAFPDNETARDWVFGGALDAVYAKAAKDDPRNADIHHFSVTESPIAFGADGDAGAF